MTDELTPVAEVVAAVERAIHPTPPARILVERCWRCVLTEDVHALVALPPHDNSAMDGFALRSEDTTGATPDAPAVLTIVGHSFAGAPPAVPCAPGDAVQIATGAMLPAGADAVVRVEDATVAGSQLRVGAPVPPGHDVRWRGEDVAHGDLILTAGSTLGMTQLASVAAAGHRAVAVHRPAHVTIVLTGDELARGNDLDPGQVPDALGPALTAALRAENAGVSVTGPIGDDDDRLAATIAAVAGTSDLVVTVGGVSVGPRDRIPHVLGRLGSVQRWRVAVKPGKPFALGQVEGTPVLSLPGNPVAALAAHELFVRAAIGQLAGRPYRPATRTARLTADVAGDGHRLHLICGVLGSTEDGQNVTPVATHGSGSVASIATADTWIVLPAGSGELGVGDRVAVRSMAGW